MNPVMRKKQIMERLTALFMCVAVAALVYIGYYLQQYYAHKSMSDNVNMLYNSTLPEKSGLVTPPPATETSVPDNTATETSVDKLEAERERLLLAEEENRVRFEELLKINQDFRGMIIIEELGLNLPYVQYTDNDKYLEIDFAGKKSDYGAIFLSAYNDRLLTDYNNIIFGHHITNGSMFQPITKYRDIKTVEKAPVIVLDSLTGLTQWLVFAAYVCEPDYGYVNPKIEGEAYAGLLEEINSRSLFHTNIEVTEEDRIITLSTCIYDFLDARFVVHARMLREGEEMPEITVEKNPMPKAANVPNHMELSEIAGKSTGVMKHGMTLKTYYYQIGESGIEWYVGDTKDIQGPYACFNGKLRADGELSSIYVNDTKTVWIATDGFKDKKGIYLLSSRSAAGTFKQLGRATPEGVDARHPLLAQDDKNIWLLYTVKESDGEKIYRLLIVNGVVSGEPEYLMTLPENSDPRMVGMFKVDENYMLVWQEIGTGEWYGGWAGYENKILLPGLKSYERIIMYDKPKDGRIPMITVKEGKAAGSAFSVNWLQPPQPTPAPEAAPPDAAEETPIPDGTETSIT